ncbi:GNAT family N-acetyltransferase [Solemya pervernicosa gill symbiont]|uniref:GNAT family N-acetyltransferase n=1 Tax=Solemya pervernicosa gill symbiont TaxID=642797 RepID=A0A1T2L4B8_9GAMM|nr:GNAT family N-acetyltransferase [Solemya pervernicosa gill symbiont]OOZ39880.1 GNAT family N-acetyltransferase [Solemya pervernicosa gill symbiont]
MTIKIAETEHEIRSCYTVMRELRTHLNEQEFVERVAVMSPAGYRLSYIEAQGQVVAVAGFRPGHNLAWGRFIYVDDLVTLASSRSKGYGRQLIEWLRLYAKEHGCGQLHLDSGLQRADAHRFYEREGVNKTSYHFAEVLGL